MSDSYAQKLFFLIALTLLPSCMSDKGTTINTPETPTQSPPILDEDKKDFTNQQLTALLESCRNGNLEIVKKLIAQGADVNAKGPENDTPLYAACWGGHEAVVSYLLAHGAVVDEPEQDNVCSNFEPLIIACRQEHVGCVRLLLKHAKDKGIVLGVANFSAYETAMNDYDLDNGVTC